MESYLYAGRAKHARELLLADWKVIRYSLLFRKSHSLRVALFYARGRTALAEWLRNSNSRQLRIEVEQFLRRVGERYGSARVEAADAFMKSENILRPERMTAMILPGHWI